MTYRLNSSSLFSSVSIEDGDQWRMAASDSDTHPPLSLVVTKRTHDYHCALVGNAAVWDCGRTHQEAIGAWMTTHGRDYGVVIDYPGQESKL